jgi:hypothetical protein
MHEQVFVSIRSPLMTWSVERMHELVERFDARVRRDLSRFDRLIAPAQARGSVLCEPASEEDVACAERRLGVRLPPSYRSFLLLSDGAYASALGAETDDGWRHGLLPVREVCTAVDGEARSVEMWCEQSPDLNNPANDDPPEPGNPKMVRYYAPYRNGLLLTHIHNGTNRLVLVPRPGVEEWELWIFAWEGATAHASFADFLDWHVTRPDHRPRPEHADAYVEAFQSGRSFTLGLLAEIADPRAIELALAELQAGSEDTRIPPLLGNLGDPEAIPVLRKTYADSSTWTMRAAALGALRRLGAEGADELLSQAAEDSDAKLRAWARRALAEDER